MTKPAHASPKTLRAAVALCLAIALPLTGWLIARRHGAGASDILLLDRQPDRTVSYPVAPAKTFYVSPDGSDSADGSQAAPFKTIEKARDTVRAVNKSSLPLGSIAVYLRGGTYSLNAAVTFAHADSGTSRNPVVYSSYPGEHAVITGAKQLTGLAKVSDPAVLARLKDSAKSTVYAIDLAANGVTPGAPKLDTGGGSPMELFQGNTALSLARWPKAGTWEKIANVSPAAQASNSASTSTTTTFTYTDSRPATWADPAEAQVHGMLAVDWFDSRNAIQSVDAATKTIVLAGKTQYGANKYADVPASPGTDTRPPLPATPGTFGIYYYENVLEELTQPGEYYIDRTHAKAYVWPTSDDIQANPVSASVSDSLIKFDTASYVTLNDLELVGSRGDAITTNDVETGMTFSNLSVHDVGGIGLRFMPGGSNVTVASSHFYNTGLGAIDMTCGDSSPSSRLDPQNCLVINSTFKSTERIMYMAPAAVTMAGTGNRIAYNEFSDMPDHAIGLFGNNAVVENNYIHDVVKLANDAGAIHFGRSQINRGGVIRNNRFENITGGQGRGATGIYFDDGQSGYTATGNYFYNVYRATVSSGSDNTITNNTIINPGLGPIWYDNRNYTWLAQMYPHRIASIAMDASAGKYKVTTTEAYGATIGGASVTLEGIAGTPSLNGTWALTKIPVGGGYDQTHFYIDAPQTAGTPDTGNAQATMDMTFVKSIRDSKGNPAYAQAYPELYARKETDLFKVTNSTVAGNLFYGVPAPSTWDFAVTAPREGIFIDRNYVAASADFVNAAAGDFRIAPGSPAQLAGYSEVDFSTVGTLPANATVLAPIGDKIVDAGTALSIPLNVQATTVSGVSQQYVLSGLPVGATYAPANAYSGTPGLIFWTPTAADAGKQAAVTVTPVGQPARAQSFRLIVNSTAASASAALSATVSGQGLTAGIGAPALQAALNAAFGNAARFTVATDAAATGDTVTSTSAGNPVFSSQTAATMQAHLSGSANNYLAAPTYQFNYVDATHLNALSNQQLGEYFAKAMHGVVADKKDWKPLQPVTVARVANVIKIRYDVPVKPLRFDTVRVAPRRNYGFDFSETSADPATIASVAIVADDTVAITLSKIPTGTDQKVTYGTAADASVAGYQYSTAAGGNLRDSDTTRSQATNPPAGWETLPDWAVLSEDSVIHRKGDINADGRVSLSEIVASIRAFNGLADADAALLRRDFGGPVSLPDVIGVIAAYNAGR